MSNGEFDRDYVPNWLVGGEKPDWARELTPDRHQRRWRRVYKTKPYQSRWGLTRRGYNEALKEFAVFRAKIDLAAKTTPKALPEPYQRAVSLRERLAAAASDWLDRYRLRGEKRQSAGLLSTLVAAELDATYSLSDLRAKAAEYPTAHEPEDPTIAEERQLEGTEEEKAEHYSDLRDQMFRELAELRKLGAQRSPPTLGGRNTPPEYPAITATGDRRADAWNWELAREFDILESAKDPIAADATVLAFIDRYLATEAKKAAAGQFSPAKLKASRVHLTYFREKFGQRAAASLSRADLVAIRDELLVKVKEWKEARADLGMRKDGHPRKTKAGTLASTSARNKLKICVAFVRSLDRDGVLDVPLRDIRDLKIPTQTILKRGFTLEELKAIIAAASPRTKLLILLGLNAAFTQVDCGSLTHEEIDWDARVIRRARTKTRNRGAPVVEYPLWDETFELLQAHATPIKPGNRVLLNAMGRPLWEKVADTSGNGRELDSIRGVFRRLSAKLKFEVHHNRFKKTSQQLLRTHPMYGLYDYTRQFGGHSPKTITEKFYITLLPPELFDPAIVWLGQSLGFPTTAGRAAGVIGVRSSAG